MTSGDRLKKTLAEVDFGVKKVRRKLTQRLDAMIKELPEYDNKSVNKKRYRKALDDIALAILPTEDAVKPRMLF